VRYDHAVANAATHRPTKIFGLLEAFEKPKPA